MKSSKSSVFLLLCISLLILLACTIFIGGPDYPERCIPVSTEAVGSMQTSIEEAIALAVVTGEVILTIDEMQLTSYLAMKFQQQDESFLTNIQVFLQEDQIQIFGTAQQGYFQATAKIILTAGIDDSGQLAVEMTSADFGPFPTPEGLLDLITATLKEILTGPIGPVATGIRLTEIDITAGQMIIMGETK